MPQMTRIRTMCDRKKDDLQVATIKILNHHQKFYRRHTPVLSRYFLPSPFFHRPLPTLFFIFFLSFCPFFLLYSPLLPLKPLFSPSNSC